MSEEVEETKMNDTEGSGTVAEPTTAAQEGETTTDALAVPPLDAAINNNPPLPISLSAATLQNTLQSTLWDLQCRAQVEATLQDLVTDVEFAVNLQDQLKNQTHQTQAERIIAEQELALEETTAVQKDRLQSQTLLADAMVRDLWTLSQEVGSLLELKQKHQAMVLEYDEVVAKLAQAEEDLHAAKTQQVTPSEQHRNRQEKLVNQQQQQQQQVAPPQQQTEQPPKKTASSSSSVTGTVVTIPPIVETTVAADSGGSVQTESSEKPPIQSAAAAAAAQGVDTTVGAAAAEDVESAKNQATEPETVADPSKTSEDPTQDESIPTVEEEENKEKDDSKPAPAVVALVEDDDDDPNNNEQGEGGEDNPPTNISLENIDMEILMRIFGFLDAFDILNTAQVNISMYSRVDSLFGFGMDNNNNNNADDNSTIATTPTVAAATSQATPTATTASLPTTNTGSHATTTANAKQQQQQQRQQQQHSKPAASSPTPAASKQPEPQFGHRLVGGGRGLLNILAGATSGAAGAATTSTTRQQQQQQQHSKSRGRGGSGDAGDGTGKPPLSEAMAHSMAAKLNDAEINAIISMTEKLRSKEKQAALMIKEKEELEGKLSGSEAVKDFLITKVRDMEKIMNKSDETEKKVTQQIASDQEVIAFLDGRVQELEQQTRVIQREKNATQEKLKAVIAQNEKKTAVLSDMLQFERQKVKENEREWKATKKLLVKEVKGCRAQIVALQAERDGYREQNDALRKAVMASGSGANANGRSSSPHR